MTIPPKRETILNDAFLFELGVHFMKVKKQFRSKVCYRFFVLACVFSVFFQVGSALAAVGSKTVAVIDGLPLSLKEFNRRYNENIKYFKFTPPTKLNVLNDIIKFELGVKEARRLGLHKRKQVQERVNAVLYQSLVDQVLGDRIKRIRVTDREVGRFCKRYPEIRTSHVYVPLRVTALKAEEREATGKITKAMKELQKGTSFEKVVAKYSEGYATSTGGDIGYQMKDRLDPAYYAAAIKLTQGAYTQKPVRSQYGLHIIKLTGKLPCKDINAADWKRMIYDEKRAKIFNDYLAKLRTKAKVQINYSLLKE